MQPTEVDGSAGEGGGQILRTAAAFAIALGRPIHVTKIRAGRRLPGLRQQHVSALEVLAAVSDGRLDGCRVGSSEITFLPGGVHDARLSFDLKTAASITLVLQAVVPAVALSGAEISLDLVGGTDVPWSPTFDYFAQVVRQGFALAGIHFEAEARIRGYFPRGGGRAHVVVRRGGRPKEIVLLERGGKPTATVVSRCGSLPEHVARRQLESALARLESLGFGCGDSSFSREQSPSPGSSVLVCHLAPDAVLGSDGLGERGRSAEKVGEGVAEKFASVADSGACLDSNLADMLAPVLALAPGESRLRIPGSTKHLETSLLVAKLFTGCEYRIDAAGQTSVLAIVPSRQG